MRESLGEAIRKGIFPTTDVDYPLAELLICIGRTKDDILVLLRNYFFPHRGRLCVLTSVSSSEASLIAPDFTILVFM